MPKYHPVFGHFLALKEAIQAFPHNTTMHVVVRHLSKQFSNGVFYLDLWPFNETLMIVTNPYVASQVEAAQLDKPAGLCATCG
jgi:sterigmatocystin biosynthesis cytochrome P450 monooxygenase